MGGLLSLGQRRACPLCPGQLYGVREAASNNYHTLQRTGNSGGLELSGKVVGRGSAAPAAERGPLGPC